MSLTQDIATEREEVNEEIRTLAGLILLEMCGSIKVSGMCRPVVAAVSDHQTELHFPTWNNIREKNLVFAEISADLMEHDVDGTVCAFAGTYKDNDERVTKAVILLMQTPDWKQMDIHPFYVNQENELVWTDPVTIDDFESPLIDMSCAN